jgi:SEC-C motif domain protein
MRCPCRKKSETTTYADCCEPYHLGRQPAPTAERLMRSRYAAFALGKADYLLRTWHPTTRPRKIEFTPEEEWVQLRVLAASEAGDRATVSFIAKSRRGGRIEALHAASRFVREDGRWYYVDDAITD